MSEQEIIEECKRRYPVGCRVNSLGGTMNSEIKFSHFRRRSLGAGGIENHDDALVYRNGTWAEIVFMPVPKELNNYLIY
jgi:hypothetical protein